MQCFIEEAFTGHTPTSVSTSLARINMQCKKLFYNWISKIQSQDCLSSQCDVVSNTKTRPRAEHSHFMSSCPKPPSSPTHDVSLGVSRVFVFLPDTTRWYATSNDCQQGDNVFGSANFTFPRGQANALQATYSTECLTVNTFTETLQKPSVPSLPPSHYLEFFSAHVSNQDKSFQLFQLAFINVRDKKNTFRSVEYLSIPICKFAAWIRSCSD